MICCCWILEASLFRAVLALPGFLPSVKSEVNVTENRHSTPTEEEGKVVTIHALKNLKSNKHAKARKFLSSHSLSNTSEGEKRLEELLNAGPETHIAFQ